MNLQRIVVTGASGILGRSIVEVLTNANLPVRRAVRNPDRVGAGTVHFDYTQPATFDPALEGAQGLLLMAPPLDPEAPAKTKPVIDKAKKAGVRQVVLISAFGVNFNEQAPLRIVEHQVMDSGIPCVILRPNFFMENFSEGSLSGTIKNQNGIFLAAGAGRTSFVSVRDIAAVAATCFSRQPNKQELDLTGPEALDHTEVAAVISEVSGRSVAYHALTEEQMVAGARAAGIPEPATGYMMVLYGVVRAGYAAAVTGDVQSTIGRRPISFREFARRHASAWML